MQSFLTTFACALAVFSTCVQAQSADVRFHQLLHWGDREAQVIVVMDKAPIEVIRQTTMGVDRTQLVFEVSDTTYTVTLVADHLVDKKAETKERKKSWLPF